MSVQCTPSVRNHATLGLPGRAGGEQDVCCGRIRHRVRNAAGRRGRDDAQKGRPAIVLHGEFRELGDLRDEGLRSLQGGSEAVPHVGHLHHRPQTALRIVRLHTAVGATRPHHPQHADQHAVGPLRADEHRRRRLPERRHVACAARGGLFELTVRQAFANTPQARASSARAWRCSRHGSEPLKWACAEARARALATVSTWLSARTTIPLPSSGRSATSLTLLLATKRSARAAATVRSSDGEDTEVQDTSKWAAGPAPASACSTRRAAAGPRASNSSSPPEPSASRTRALNFSTLSSSAPVPGGRNTKRN
mmetsp:Transcript_84578/g.242817  ORF Transcript_84578/g.242817 Transcript_84578/m.242817 type:complete len:309 (+) Transcript_84578:3298-4224(+)